MFEKCYTVTVVSATPSLFHQTRWSLLLFSVERPQLSSWLFLSLTVHAGYVCVVIIHQTLIYGLQKLYSAHRCQCIQLHTGLYGHRKRVCTESWLWEENPLPRWGNEPALAAWWCDAPTHWATSHPQYIPSLLSFCTAIWKLCTKTSHTAAGLVSTTHAAAVA